MAPRPAGRCRLRRTPPPTTVGRSGRYRLGEVLGHGRSIVVRRGFDRVLERDVAVKLIGAAQSARTDNGGSSRWRRELDLPGSLDHRSILPVLDGGPVDPDRPGAGWFVVTPLVPGRLDHRLACSGPLGVEEAAELGASLAAALGHGHRRGVTHPDLDVRHVLLGHDGTPYLTGYATTPPAASAPARPGGGLDAGPDPSRTPSADPAPATDLVCLAGVLATCLTGRRGGRTVPDELLVVLGGIAADPDPSHEPHHREHLRAGLEVLASSPRTSYRHPPVHPLVAATVRRLRPVTADGRVGRLAAVAGAGLCLAVLTAVGVSVPRPLSSPSIPAPPPARAHTTTEPRSAAPELAAPPAVLDHGPHEIAAAPAAPAGTTGTAEHRTAAVVLAAQRTGRPDRAAQARTDQPGRADGRTAETAGHDPGGDSGSSGDSDSSGASDSTRASGSSGDSDSTGSTSTGASDSSGDRGGGDRDGAGRDHGPRDRGKDSTSDLQEHSLGSLDVRGGDVAHDDEATADAPVAGIDVSVGDAVDSAGDRGGDAGRVGERTRGPAAALPAALDGSALDDHDGRG